MNTFGKKLQINIFGQSHSDAIGVVIEGLPAGFEIDMQSLNNFLKRRVPGGNALSTSRKEADTPEFISGLVNNKTCGAALCAIIKNTDTKSKDYDNLKAVMRPSHADYAAYVKFGGFNDIRGGGQFSGRLTAPLCVAGGIALQILSTYGIKIGAHVSQINGIKDISYNPVDVRPSDFEFPTEFPALDSCAAQEMSNAIIEAKKQGDSLGGIIECAVIGMQPGFGSPMFDGVENVISQSIFAIPAVKGIEFGAGFEVARMRGSQNNDCFEINNNNICTKTNNCGGILGGITNGMPIIFRAAFKPTPSIALTQDSVDVTRMENCKLSIQGRHDPCIVPRAVPVVEAATAIAVLDIILQGK